MVSEAEYSIQETERIYGRIQIATITVRLNKANKAIKILGNTLKEFRNINDNRDQHSDDYLDALDNRIQTILHELEELPNGY